MKKHGFGRVLGSIWEGFGTLWGVFWPLLGDFCSFFDVLNDVFFKHGSKMDSKTPFGSILGGSWKDLGVVVPVQMVMVEVGDIPEEMGV